MLTRRAVLAAPVAALAAKSVLAQAGKMTLAIHQNTSSGAGYRGSLEGWAKAGIRYAELTAALLDEFLKGDTLASARRVLTDNGLTPVSAACGVNGLWEPNPKHDAAIDDFKRRCEQFATLGLTRIYAPSTATGMPFSDDDYKTTADNMRKVGEAAAQFKLVAMVEATRASTLIGTLPTMLKVTRAANHPNMKPLLDFYHFWSGNNKLEDLDQIRNGEIGHVHFQDVPDMPREQLGQQTRVIPGDGVAPVSRILRALAEKRYAGSLSVELFLPQFAKGDPFAVAGEIRQKCERVMRGARVV
jgi:sugar phosphate isomerase/epimerase